VISRDWSYAGPIPAAAGALDALGEDSVMYSVDYPFESMDEAAKWLDAAKLDAHVRAKIEHENAQALLKLNQPAA